jgi:hypothetical protein
MSLVIENFSGIKKLSAAQSSVIRTLAYFDLFKHPLKAKEIFHLLQDKNFPEEKIVSSIESLCKAGLIFKNRDYYFLQNDAEIVDRRLKGEKFAEQSLITAEKYSGLIARFPFVRGIALSGSISKNYMDSESDIDYFIITAPGRLWVARTLLILYKKIILMNSRKYFCVNYFLSEDALEVPDKNIFTATEASFLIPTYNYPLYRRFMDENNWSKHFLPNFPVRTRQYMVADKKYSLRTLLEKLLSGKTGEKLDSYFFRMTIRFWKKKFSHFDEGTFDFRLRSRKNVSKHHPLGYQEKVLTRYSEKLSSFAKAHSISFHEEDPVYA